MSPHHFPSPSLIAVTKLSPPITITHSHFPSPLITSTRSHNPHITNNHILINSGLITLHHHPCHFTSQYHQQPFMTHYSLITSSPSCDLTPTSIITPISVSSSPFILYMLLQLPHHHHHYHHHVTTKYSQKNK
ncbi:hypothetical protein E2C01_079926 [Portunus trituberculatus]|uniref:Uncharacterized protein n=1 Tax=Portunus trituberculatus TaxID=210409 RepID=A0A5B7IS24_PORTR|nr:hypothetical protein [Portunus trituberculatus]